MTEDNDETSKETNGEDTGRVDKIVNAALDLLDLL